jgi:hypothetical protein
MTAIWVPTNTSTQTIGYNQRFLISDVGRFPALCYEVSKISDTSPVGLIKFSLTQTMFNEDTDNIDLMIADYWASNVEPVESNIEDKLFGTAEIAYSGKNPTVKVGGSIKTFTPVFSAEGVTVDKWLISDENGDIGGNSNYTIEHVGEQLKLKVAQNYDIVGNVLIIQVVGSDGSTAQISVEVVS